MDGQYPLALPIGTVLAGQYIIEKVLGEGGFGITYYAIDHKSGGGVAIKEYFPDSMATRTQSVVVPYTGDRGDNYEYGKECFLQEAETLAQFIGNENIVRIHSFFEENGTAYYVMDYVEGRSFDKYIASNGGKLPIEETLKILTPIMDALSLVHSRGIIHRDVTPDNIIITKEGSAKLLDFGAARYSLGDKSQSLDVILKHGFAPKEQYVRRGKQGPFTDVYALGATFYFALTGKRPPDSIERMDDDKLIPPSSLGVALPKEAEQAILRALSVQPSDRFQNMQSFRNALGQESQDTVKPVVQRFFSTPDSSEFISQSFSDDQMNMDSHNDTSIQSSIVNNGVDYVSKSQDILNKVGILIDKNLKKIEYLTIGLLTYLFIWYARRDLPYYTGVSTISKTLIISVLLSKIILVVAIFKQNKKAYILGFGLRILEMVLWFKVQESVGISAICFELAEIAVAILLIMIIMGKRIQTYAMYVVGIVSMFCAIIGDFSILRLEAVVSIILIAIITHQQGGEKNGFN